MNKIITDFKTGKYSKKTLVLCTITLLLLVLMITVFVSYNTSISAISSKTDKVIFEVVNGDTLDSITTRLENKKIIKNATFTRIAAKIDGTSSFLVGQYRLDRNWRSPTILKYMTKQENILKDEVMLTFREGIWAKDIAKKIAENTNVTSESLIALWNDDAFLRKCIKKYSFLDESILKTDYRVKIEGYLFPETYSFHKKTTPEAVTYTFLNQFEKAYAKIEKEVKNSKLSMHEIITLASIVQYESAKVEDMKLIAGVFFNRLAINQKLESSVTVCYSLYNYKDWQECELNTDIDSPYNTYMYEGLPVGPILNPGLDAIEAVLKPKKSDYFYFIADVHGDNTVYYAKTFEEHLKNQKKYLGY